MPRTPSQRQSLWAQVGFYSSLGFILPAGAVGGFGIGWVLDRWLHTSPVFALALGVIGAAAGVVEILRILTRAEKRFDNGGPNNHGPDAS
ncbi:MAG TPA: AtpZ/AtpI family protein [Terriglobia bacterium]|nr:AtpZ/AtpI family protein [Terriglobia bacterium]